jgi:hypothetical protein
VRGRTADCFEGEMSSLPSKRLDIAPLCQVLEAPIGPACRCEVSDAVAAPVEPAMYMAALPLPGRADGRRLTITEDDRGTILESSLYSA